MNAFYKKCGLILLFCIPLLTFGQVVFVENQSWKEVLSKAKNENKYIFVDCFTSWCTVCKYMDNEVFVSRSLGQFMNDKFVSYKLQMDQEDNTIQAAEAKSFEKKYKIESYPSFLVFSPDGKILTKIVGGSDQADFFEKIKNALHPDHQYYPLLDKFAQNKSNVVIAKLMYTAASLANDEITAQKSEKVLADNLNAEDFFKKENTPILIKNTKFIHSKTFELLRNNKEKVDILMEQPGLANQTLTKVVVNQLILPKYNATEEPKWDELKKNLSTKFPDLNFDPIFKRIQAHYYLEKGEYSKLKDAVNDYLKSEDYPASQLNTFAWKIFENSTDMDCINAAISWTKKAILDEPKSAYIDTYANLLYKKGNTAEALKWQEKAVEVASENDRAIYQSTLEKMRQNKPTWK